jgi:hypothetical protein
VDEMSTWSFPGADLDHKKETSRKDHGYLLQRVKSCFC